MATALCAACSTTYVAAAGTAPPSGQAASDAQAASTNGNTVVDRCRDTNVLTDPKNRGTCGTVCGKAPNSVGVACVAGTCTPTCAPDFHINAAKTCEANAACTGYDTTKDANNCGACGVICVLPANASNVQCVSSTCTPTCNSGYAPNGTVCVCNNTANDVNNCGSCGFVCSKPSNAESVSCSAGACVPKCAAGYYRSGTRCIVRTGPCDGLDLQADTENCGTCGNTCFDAQHPQADQAPAGNDGIVRCVAGRCEMYCNTGFGSSSFDQGCNCVPSTTGGGRRVTFAYPICATR